MEDLRPNWADAPEWAQWLAMDCDGTWFWYENKPKRHAHGLWDANGRYEVADASGINWATSLEWRPE